MFKLHCCLSFCLNSKCRIKVGSLEMIRIYALNREANISTRDCILKKREGMFLCQSGQEIADVQNLKYLNKSDLLVMIWKMF